MSQGEKVIYPGQGSWDSGALPTELPRHYPGNYLINTFLAGLPSTPESEKKLDLGDIEIEADPSDLDAFLDDPNAQDAQSPGNFNKKYTAYNIF